MTTSTILFLVLYSDAGAVSSYTTDYEIAAGGDAAAVIASAVAAAGFFVSSWRQRKDQPRWPAGRDVTLGVATAIFAVIVTYNEFLVALVLTSSPGSETVPVGTSTLITRIDIDWGAMSAAGTLAAIPIVGFALLVQRHLVRGLTLGAIK